MVWGMRLLIYFILFAVVGVAQEVFWTGFLQSTFRRRDTVLNGTCSLWMFPIYGSILFIIMLVRWIYPSYPWWFRGLMYVMLIMLWEYFSGWIIRKLFGIAPWDYAGNPPDDHIKPKKFNINGLICLEFVPSWFIGGLLFEALYLFLQTL